MSRVRWFLGASALAALLGVVLQGQAEEKPVPDRELAAWVDQRIQDWQPVKEERRLDAIGWAPNLAEAQRLAKEQKRPVFLFTYSGSETRANAIALQRC